MSEADLSTLLDVGGIALALIGVAVPILWPNKRGVGWVFLAAGVLLFVADVVWGVRRAGLLSVRALEVGVALIALFSVAALAFQRGWWVDHVQLAGLFWPVDSRLSRVRKLIHEAAKRTRERSTATIDQGVAAAVLHYNILQCLRSAFQPRVQQDYRAYVDALDDKYGNQIDAAERVARALEHVADSLTRKDLDRGFLLPNSFEQYDAW